MKGETIAFLEDWVASGGGTIGEITVGPGYSLRHHLDPADAPLELHPLPSDARHIANLDAGGKFRPLKTAPTLRRGWMMRLRDAAELREALDHFYPAMLGLWLAARRGDLRPTHLRETLDRQTGMYAVTKQLTGDEARALVARTCSGCLKQRLWEPDPDGMPDPAPGVVPLLCHEACNLLVAEARTVVKSRA
jgi:hypothetical protein